MPRVTITEVAKKLGVSKMTVSRVINGTPGVSEELRGRIRKAIEEMGYTPDAMARGLARGRSHLIGVLVPDIYSEWISPLFVGIGEEADHSGYQVLLRSTGYGKSFSEESHIFIDSGLVDGVIVASWLVPAGYITRLRRKGIPVVVIDGLERSKEFFWISSQDREGAVEAVRYLASLGHERIAFIGGGEKSYLGQQRLEGFLEGLKETGLKREDIVIEQGDFQLESGKNIAKRILAMNPRPTAIFAANDPMGIGVMQAAHEAGLHIPEDLSVVGFDDTLAKTAVPPMTTVRRDYTSMGKTAVRVLMDAFQGNLETRTVVQIDVQTELVIRQSTRRMG